MQAVSLVLGFSDRVLPVLWAGLELVIFLSQPMKC